MEYIIHAANILYLVSYLVKDILWLRTLTVVAIFSLLPYFYIQPEPLYAAIAWNLVFAVINIYQIYLLLLERRPVKLSADEQKLYQKTFHKLKPREFLKLMHIARWKEAIPAEPIVKKGEVLDKMLIIFSGTMNVEDNGRFIAELHDGQFVGEMSYITGQETSANVVAKEPTRYVFWAKEELDTFLDKQPDIKGALQYVLGTDLCEKLKAR